MDFFGSLMISGRSSEHDAGGSFRFNTGSSTGENM